MTQQNLFLRNKSKIMMKMITIIITIIIINKSGSYLLLFEKRKLILLFGKRHVSSSPDFEISASFFDGGT